MTKITSDGITATDILKAAAGHMKDRATTYDKPEGERSMGATAEAFNAVTGHHLTEEQGWLFMALLKAVRSQQGGYRADSYEDGAAYFALAGESAARDRTRPSDMAPHRPQHLAHRQSNRLSRPASGADILRHARRQADTMQ